MGQSSRISDLEQAAEERRNGVSDWAANQVSAQPLSALCAAFAAGFVVGVGTVSALSMAAVQSSSSKRQAEHLSDRIAQSISQNLPRQLADLWPR